MARSPSDQCRWCGHTRAEHHPAGKHPCTRYGCTCPQFLRAWRKLRNPPAAATPAPRPARTIVAPRMTIGHQHGGLAQLVNVYTCGCVFVWHASTQEWKRTPCPAARFEAHWNERLTQ